MSQYGTTTLSVRVPWEVRQELMEIANRRGVSINDLLQQAIHKTFLKEDSRSEILERLRKKKEEWEKTKERRRQGRT